MFIKLLTIGSVCKNTDTCALYEPNRACVRVALSRSQSFEMQSNTYPNIQHIP